MPSLQMPEMKLPTLPKLGRPSLPNLNLPSRRANSGALVGVEIEAGAIGAAEVQANGTAQLTATASIGLPPEAFREGEVQDPEAVTAALKALFERNELSPRVRLGIASKRVVVRTLRLPAIDDPDELDAAIRFSAQEEIPMPLDEAVLDHRVIGGVSASEDAPPQVDVIVVAARREMIADSVKPLRDAGLEAVGVDLSAFAMIRALSGYATAPAATEGESPAPATVLFWNLGDVSNLAVAKGRSCLFTRVAPVGLDEIVGRLSERTGLSPEHAEMWLRHVGLSQPEEQIEGDPALVADTRATLEQGVASLIDELRLSLDFYGAQEAAAAVERVVVSGAGSAIPGLVERIEPELRMPIEVGTPQALAGFDPASAARLTLPYGLALEQ